MAKSKENKICLGDIVLLMFPPYFLKHTARGIVAKHLIDNKTKIRLLMVRVPEKYWLNKHDLYHRAKGNLVTVEQDDVRLL